VCSRFRALRWCTNSIKITNKWTLVSWMQPLLHSDHRHVSITNVAIYSVASARIKIYFYLLCVWDHCAYKIMISTVQCSRHTLNTNIFVFMNWSPWRWPYEWSKHVGYFVIKVAFMKPKCTCWSFLRFFFLSSALCFSPTCINVLLQCW